MNSYDYIIAGAGAAGLSLLMRMIDSGKLSDKKILLVDRTPKIKNDRTWCFWEKEPGIFEPIIYKEWQRLWFHGEGYSKLHDISPYRYKLIRGIDFYKYCFKTISEQPNITVLYGDIKSCVSNESETFIMVDEKKIAAAYIFSSILPERKPLKPNQYYLLQHFKGWIIETSIPRFDPSQATLMDFRISQDAGTAFVYVMPFSPTKALVEYTLFS
ncbi:MAG: lycopene cyclase family protein, partial [Flavitalea sp.]